MVKQGDLRISPHETIVVLYPISSSFFATDISNEVCCHIPLYGIKNRAFTELPA